MRGDAKVIEYLNKGLRSPFGDGRLAEFG
jgi:hypothetical protein